jgi:hypothetical protein
VTRTRTPHPQVVPMEGEEAGCHRRKPNFIDLNRLKPQKTSFFKGAMCTIAVMLAL